MALWLRVHGGYPSYAESGEAWGATDFVAFKFVQALKGNAIKGYAWLPRPVRPLKIDADDCSAAFTVFGEWGAQQVQQLGTANPRLVPVPSSSCLALGTDEKGRKLAACIAERAPGSIVSEMLHWHEAHGKTADSGSRDPAVLLANLRVAQGVPPSNIILIDDVATTGGHLLACARALRHFGHTVENAICAAQTVWTHPQDMWKVETRDLEAHLF